MDAAAEASHHSEADPEAVSEASAPAADSAAVAAPAARYSRVGAAAGVLAVVALVAALYLARGFIVPLLIGILASYALHPLVDWLQACRVPRSVGAALVLAVLVGSSSWVAFSLSDDAAAVIEKLPEAARKLRQNLSAARTSSPTALQSMQEAALELQGAAADAGAQSEAGAKLGTSAGTRARPEARAVAAQAPETTWLRDYALTQSALLFAVVGQTPIVLLLTYFLLASGKHFRRKLVGLVGPSNKKGALQILEEIDVQIQRYLLATLVSNILVAVTTWLAFEALGMEQAGAWGVAAGLLHFVPYLGPGLIAIACGVAGFLQFGSLLSGLAVAGVSLLVAGAIGMVFTTWLQSRFGSVNAAVLFIALLFFGWLWGAWGLLLGAPLVVIAKVICDRVESLKPVGEMLGR